MGWKKTFRPPPMGWEKGWPALSSPSIMAAWQTGLVGGAATAGWMNAATKSVAQNVRMVERAGMSFQFRASQVENSAGIGRYGFEKEAAELRLLLLVELCAEAGDVEDVDGHLTFGVDEGDLDVATL